MVKYIVIVMLLLLPSCAEAEKSMLNTPLPLLHIQPAVYDLGDIQEGEAAIANFLVRNNHQEAIELVDIQASCGCTVAEPDSYMVMPGGLTQLHVVVDTTAKQSNVKKVVHVRDSLGSSAVAILTFNVISNPHRSQNVEVKGIFDGVCASCHYEPLLNKQAGIELYDTGCAMCHGEGAGGAYAPNLRGFSSLKRLKAMIAQGVGKPQMPGFSQKFGGPLQEEQIHALAMWLMSLPKNQE